VIHIKKLILFKKILYLVTKLHIYRQIIAKYIYEHNFLILNVCMNIISFAYKLSILKIYKICNEIID